MSFSGYLHCWPNEVRHFHCHKNQEAAQSPVDALIASMKPKYRRL